jgi:hypothetical protein
MLSGVPKVARSMRIIALPLTKPTTSRTQLARKISPLIYYHFQINNSGKNLEDSWMKWATTKASNLWASLGKAKEGSWKVSFSARV